MSTITTINSTDQVNNSRAVINTNFSNLNTDKLEAATTATLTNKTFDANGTGNSLSNVEIADFKADAKTGNATKAVTGTAGTDGNLLKWDANSNAVDSTFSVSDVSVALTDSATTLPVESKVKDYVDALTKQMWVPIAHFRDTSGGTNLFPYQSTLGDFPSLTLDVSDYARFSFVVPTGYTSLTSAYVYFIATNTGNFDMIATSTFATSPNLYNTSTDTTDVITKTCTQNNIYSLDVSGAITSIVAGDLVGLSVEFDALASGAGAPSILGLHLIWA